MKLLQKVLVSLLIATLLFTVFAVTAYTGLFELIDQRFYNERVRESSRAILTEARRETADYQREIHLSVNTLATLPALSNVFLINQSRQDAEEQAEAVGKFIEEYPEIDFIRIVDNNRGNIWFSTLESDVRSRTDLRIEYKPTSELEIPLLLPPPGEEGHQVTWVPGRAGLRITAPIIDGFEIPRGLLVAWANTHGLFTSLVSEGILGPSSRLKLTETGVLVYNAPRHFSSDDFDLINRYVANGETGVLESDIGASFAVEVIEADGSLPPTVYLINEADLHMDESLRWILLGSVFIVTFLIAYLILNIKQDPNIVVAERFRRFQQQILRDYLREGRAIAPDVWQKELDGRKEQIEGELQRGLGKLKDEDRTKIQQNMDQSWSELYRIMGSQGTGKAQLEQVSLQQIEQIIERTLARYGHQTGVAPPPGVSRRVIPQHSGSTSPSTSASDRLEEIDEIQELEDVGSAELQPVDVEDVSDVEDLEEIEALEPVELEELDELDELEPEELDEAEDVEEIGELEEVSTLEEVTELEEVEDLEELDELEGLEPEAPDKAEALEPVELEQLSELEELEPDELDEVEALDPVEPEELDELEELEPEELEALDETETPEPVEPEAPLILDEPEDDWLTIDTTVLELTDQSDLGVAAESAEPDGSESVVEDIEELDAAENLDNIEELVELVEISELPELPELDGITELEDISEFEEVSELEIAEDDSGPVIPVLPLESGSMPFLSAATSFGGVFTKPDAESPRASERPDSEASAFRPDELGVEQFVIRGLENSAAYHVVELDDFILFAGRKPSVIEELRGVAQIQAAAYFAETQQLDVRMQNLVDQILYHKTTGSIEDIMGDAFEDIDFGDLFDTDLPTGGVGTQPYPERTNVPLQIVSGGFELPNAGESGDAGVRQMYRELVRLTRRWDARVAVVLEGRQDGGVFGSFTLGMPTECSDRFEIAADSDLVENVFSFRRVALLKKRLGAFRDFHETCYARRLASLGSWLFLPLKTGSGPGSYLMVGFPRSFDDILDLTSRYEIVSRTG